MKASDILKGVIALFKDPKHWAQQFYAFNAQGLRVSATHEDATCFCLRGAVQKLLPRDGSTPRYELMSRAEGFICQALAQPGERPEAVNIAQWNDAPGRKITEVRAVVRKALKLALDTEAQAA